MPKPNCNYLKEFTQDLILINCSIHYAFQFYFSH